MARKNRRGSEEKPSPDVLGPLQDIIRQLREGKLTREQLQALAEHKDPFAKTQKELEVSGNTPSERAVQMRAVQMEIFKERGYSLKEDEVPFPDERFVYGEALLVDYQTPAVRQCRLLGIKNQLYLEKFRDDYSVSSRRWGWIYNIEDGRLEKSTPQEVKNRLSSINRRGLTTVEGLALYCIKPDIWRDHGICLIASYGYKTYDSGTKLVYPSILEDDGITLAYDKMFDPEWLRIGFPSCIKED